MFEFNMCSIVVVVVYSKVASEGYFYRSSATRRLLSFRRHQ